MAIGLYTVVHLAYMYLVLQEVEVYASPGECVWATGNEMAGNKISLFTVLCCPQVNTSWKIAYQYFLATDIKCLVVNAQWHHFVCKSYVSVHSQLGSCQWWDNCFMCWSVVSNRWLLNLRDTIAAHSGGQLINLPWSVKTDEHQLYSVTQSADCKLISA